MLELYFELENHPVSEILIYMKQKINKILQINNNKTFPQIIREISFNYKSQIKDSNRILIRVIKNMNKFYLLSGSYYNKNYKLKKK